MSRRALPALLAALLAAPDARASGRVAVVVGDSLAYMMFPHLRGTGIRVRGRGGTNLGQWLKEGWLLDVLRKDLPDLVMVSLGTNDSGVRVNREAFGKRAARLVELCTVSGADVLWLIPPRGRDFIESGARRSGGLVLDARPLPIEMYSDRVHPTPRGFRTWVRAILDRIGPEMRPSRA